MNKNSGIEALLFAIVVLLLLIAGHFGVFDPVSNFVDGVFVVIAALFLAALEWLGIDVGKVVKQFLMMFGIGLALILLWGALYAVQDWFGKSKFYKPVMTPVMSVVNRIRAVPDWVWLVLAIAFFVAMVTPVFLE